MQMHPVLLTLPDAVALRIGRLVSWYSTLEWLLHNTLYALKNVDVKAGREAGLAKRLKNPSEFFILFEQLAEQRQQPLKFLTPQLAADAQKAHDIRDCCAHYAWVAKPGTGHVAMLPTRKEWPLPTEFGRLPRGHNRNAKPEAIILTQADFDHADAITKSALVQMHLLYEEVRGQGAYASAITDTITDSSSQHSG